MSADVVQGVPSSVMGAMIAAHEDEWDRWRRRFAKGTRNCHVVERFDDDDVAAHQFSDASFEVAEQWLTNARWRAAFAAMMRAASAQGYSLQKAERT